MFAAGVDEPILDPAVDQRVAWLVQDRLDEAIGLADSAGEAGLLGGVVGERGVERLARAHGGVQRTHCLFQWCVWIGTVGVEDIHVIELQALQAGIQACH